MDTCMRRSTFPIFPFFIGAVLLIALLLVGVSYGEHALVRHGEQAFSGRSCYNNPTSIQFFNPNTNRFASVCQTPDGKWAMFIYERVNGTVREVTSFVKDKMKSFEQVQKYMGNAGYNQLP